MQQSVLLCSQQMLHCMLQYMQMRWQVFYSTLQYMQMRCQMLHST